MIADAEVPVLPNDLIVDMIMNAETTIQSRTELKKALIDNHWAMEAG